MGYEIDFLPVGEGERGGDAIAVRYGDLLAPQPDQFVMIIDGGTKDSGRRLVEQVKTYYHTDRVDLVVSTHPDSDHSSGLTEVLQNLNVSCLWMHMPWEHSDDMRKLLRDGRIIDQILSADLIKSWENVNELELIAEQRGIPIIEPFSNILNQDDIVILGPSRSYYESLLPGFRSIIERDEATLPRKETGAKTKPVQWEIEQWETETLVDPGDGDTSAENNSGVILLLALDDNWFLFTGDAGVSALNEAADFAERHEYDLRQVKSVQVPHHGSRHNVGPTILNRIVGDILTREGTCTKSAYISAPREGDPVHPSRKVCNAYRRRGANVFENQGKTMWCHKGAPERGWEKNDPLPFYTEVEK